MTETTVTLARVARTLGEAGLDPELRGDPDRVVTGVTQDSRTVGAGDLFLAWSGTKVDAHDFLGAALAQGAAGAVVERFVDLPLPQLRVTDGRRAAAIVAHLLVGEPTDRMQVVAVTGTNGKTTTAFLARHLLGRRSPTAMIGTLGVVGPEGRIRPGTEGLTTPGPVQIARVLADLEGEGVTTVTLEASSHALDQRRLDGLRVEVGVFTNLTRDHLDYHGTFRAYRDAKARLLNLVPEEGTVVLNGGDPAWSELPPVRSRLLITGVEGDPVRGRPASTGGRHPDLVAEKVELSGEGSRFRVRWGGDEAAVSLPLLGRFNVENALGALGAALACGMALEEGAAALSAAPPPVGRLEVAVRSPIPVILDYAHTPDALRRVLETLRPLYPGRLILVFGAGGDRDREKRPQMGRVAVEGADVILVTSDNPRSEDPEAILDEIRAGMEGAPHERIPDRREAIARALDLARPGDAVLLAGKGHETVQLVGAERRPFDERQILRELLGGGTSA